MSATTLEARVRTRLEQVLDPCSCFTQEPVSIVDLGLVEDVTVCGAVARVAILPTSPGCTYLPYIEQDVERRAGAVAGIERVEVSTVTDEIWTRERMDDEVREARRQALHDRLADAGITPYAERDD